DSTVSEIAIPSVEPRYAELLPRVGAMVIDVVIGWIVLAIPANVLDPSALGNNPSPHDTAMLGVIALIALTLWFNYLVIGEWRWGQTLGKAAVGIRVVGEDERGVTWNRAVVRNLLLVVDFVLGLFMIPLSERGQRLGDRAGHTLVLAKRRDQVAP